MKKSIASLLVFSSLIAIAFVGCSHKKTMESDAQMNPPPASDSSMTSTTAPEPMSSSATATTPDNQVTQVASLGASSSGRSR